MSNAGQTCIGAERVYVHEAVADRFIEKITELARKVESGKNYGPATMPSQLKVISAHINDAKQSGATFLLGGIESVGERYVSPVLISDLDENSMAMQEETFGPTLVINRVKDMNDAIDRTNATKYGLGAAVFSKRNGEAIAARIESGMVSIVKESGYGRIHGPEGLLEFTYPKSTVKARFQLPLHFTTFRRSAFADKIVVALIKLLHGRGLG
jgi:acyl-CoA reductase-like NAD-dependent aldehyde dehydrogenase